jgi:flagellar hook-associated protein 1 FlgK
MGGLFDSLGLASQSLQAQQAGAQITGANVGNANAPGYHREDPIMTSASAYRGVQTVSLMRSVDNTLERQVNTQSGNLAFANNRAQGLEGLVRYVGDMTQGGLGAAVNGFFNAWRNMTVHPEDQAIRADTLGRTQALVDRVNTIAQSTLGGQRQADAQIQSIVDAANVQINMVAKLNVAIVAAQAGSSPAADMQDARDMAVSQLATLTGATSSVDAQGSISVYVGGVSVVSEDVAYMLDTAYDATQGFTHVTVDNTTQGAIDSRITSGALGAQLKLRDTDLASSMQDLDQFVTDLTTAVNTAHAAGYGYDGQTGRNLFATYSGVSGAALALKVDPNVANTPAALAAAASGVNVPGDNTVAAQITALSSGRLAKNNTQTFSQSVASLVSGAGLALSEAKFEQTQSQTYLDQTQSLWQQANGVSLQDQMLQLTRYQSAFQATTKLISSIDEMMQSLQRM